MAILRQLHVDRSAVLIISAFMLITAGVWTVAAALWGAAIGAGVGMVVGGVAVLVLEGLSEDTP